MFEEHQFIKLINNNWVFDLTEFIGYKVKLDKDDNVISYKEAFQVLTVGEELIFEKFIRVPLKILKEASNQIKLFWEDTGVSIDE